jgi:hypothetical protein
MITKTTTEVYFSTSKKQRYFSKRAAINGEVNAILSKRYPPIKKELDTGDSFHWTDLPRSSVLARRLKRIVKVNIL